ncbi:MAG: L-threonine 3-dehydrogenase [Gemmatimonadota bacterium]|nr:L-threonine 3-dehydrogenase [Gemmatimonadota bacterium]MDH5804577.1 L-threonine 3-dehydrogenase [Gemmatimonadota bacterium]
MQAIRKEKPGPGLTLGEAKEPECGHNDVIIRVRHAGVCGTDVHIAEWDEWAQGRLKPPLTIGHEFAGEIAEIGSEVTEPFKVGDPVTAEGHLICGHCKQCRTGNGHVCRNTQIIGVDRDGAFATYIAMPAANVVPLHDIPTRIGAVMDPLGNAFHTVLTADIPGHSVLIMGSGPIGCFAVGIAKAAGAVKVIAVDVNPKRLELAKTMGADLLLNAATDDVVQAVLDATEGDGADVVCEMSGNPTAMRQALKCVRLGGRIQMLGLPKEDVTLPIASDLIFKGITLYGVIGRRMFDTWHQMLDFLKSGLLDPNPIITHEFPLDQVDDALAAIAGGDAGKVILEIGEDR